MQTPIQNLLIGLLQPFAKESITVSSSVKTLTQATYKPASPARQAIRAIITLETAPIRYWYDGSTPDANTGHLFIPTTTLTVVGYEAITNLKMIADTATDGVIRVTYER